MLPPAGKEESEAGRDETTCPRYNTSTHCSGEQRHAPASLFTKQLPLPSIHLGLKQKGSTGANAEEYVKGKLHAKAKGAPETCSTQTGHQFKTKGRTESNAKEGFSAQGATTLLVHICSYAGSPRISQSTLSRHL